MRQKLFTIFLWLAVINLSIWIGGTFFHMIVVLPIWSGQPPDSVRGFFGGTRAYECGNRPIVNAQNGSS